MRPKNLNALINLPPPGLCAHFRQSWRLNDGIYGSCLHLQNLSASVVQFWTHHCTYNDEDGGSLAETNDTKGVFPFSVESARSPPPLWQLRGQKRRMDPIRAISAPAVHCTSANFSHSQSEDEEVLWRGGSIMKRGKHEKYFGNLDLKLFLGNFDELSERLRWEHIKRKYEPLARFIAPGLS